MNWDYVIIFVSGLLIGMVIVPLAAWWLIGFSERGEEKEIYEKALQEKGEK